MAGAGVGSRLEVLLVLLNKKYVELMDEYGLVFGLFIVF